jgi:hypothetical protein
MQDDAKTEENEMDQCHSKHFLPALVDVGNVPLVSQLTVTQSITEYVLNQRGVYHEKTGEEGVDGEDQKNHLFLAGMHSMPRLDYNSKQT